MGTTFFVVYNAFHKYYSRPINTVISTAHVNKMNFPAITICPLNFFAKSKIFMTDDNPLFASNGLNLTLCALTSKVRVSLPCGVSVLCCCTPREFLHFIRSRLPNCTSQYRQDLLEALQQSPNDHDVERFHRNYAQDIKVLVGSLCAFGWQKLPCSSNDFVSMVTSSLLVPSYLLLHTLEHARQYFPLPRYPIENFPFCRYQFQKSKLRNWPFRGLCN